MTNTRPSDWALGAEAAPVERREARPRSPRPSLAAAPREAHEHDGTPLPRWTAPALFLSIAVTLIATLAALVIRGLAQQP